MKQEPEYVTMTVPVWLWDAMSKAYYGHSVPARSSPVREVRSTEEEVPEHLGDTVLLPNMMPAGWEPQGVAKRSAKRPD